MSAHVAVLLRRLQPRPGAPGSGADEAEVLGRCEGGALSAALDVASRMGGSATAIAVGPARREDRVLAMALRAGCGRAVRIDDSQLGDVDYLGVAQVLAAAIKHVKATLVVCGDRSGDEATGAIGPAIAELLECSHVTSVSRLAIEGEQILVVRHGDGVDQRLRVQAPVVLCVAAAPVGSSERAVAAAPDDDEEEESPSERVRRSRTRARTPAPTIDELDLADLGIDPRQIAPRRTTAGRLRQVRSRGVADLSTTAADLVSRLRTDRLLGDE